MKKIFKFLIALMVCGLTLTFFTNTAWASPIVYEQLPGHYGGYLSGGVCPPDTLLITVADDFQLSQPAEIVGIKWWGGYVSPYQPTPVDNFIIMLFDDNAGEPGNLLYRFNVGVAPVRKATGDWVNPPSPDFEGRPEFEYFFNLPTSFVVGANTLYWLSIVNIPSADSWVWEASSPGTVQRSWNNPVDGPWGPWNPYFDNMAFQLSISMGVLDVPIDIKPDSDPNSINLGSGGTVPVAIFSTPTFDATTIDPLTVTLESAPVQLKGKGTPMTSKEDINGDGLLDLVVHISIEALQLNEGNTVAVLEGLTFNGLQIRGTDSVSIVPP